MTPRFAVLLPVVPREDDIARANAFLESVAYHEPQVAWCVLVEDAPHLSDAKVFASPGGCTQVSLLNPRQGRGWHGRNRLTAGMLLGLDWIQANTDAEFVLKVDSDALVIAPFSGILQRLFQAEPEAGIVGSLGTSCNPAIRARQKVRFAPRLRQAFDSWPPSRKQTTVDDPLVEVPGFGRLSAAQLRAFDEIRPHIGAAIAHGYAWPDYCEGGAFAVSRIMLDRMRAAGHFEAAEVWIRLPFADDVAMAMYTHAVGLQMRDCSRAGQPFAIQSHGLPYSPAELKMRGYSLIHSVKTDTDFAEEEIRRFFTDTRGSARHVWSTTAFRSTASFADAALSLRTSKSLASHV